MDNAYILALLRRRDLGTSRDVILLVSIMDGDQLGRIVHLPVQALADGLGVSYGRAKVLRRKVVDHCLLELVGRQSVRRTRPSAWRQMGLKSSPVGDTIPAPNGVGIQSQVGAEKQASGYNPSPEAMGLKSRPVDRSESRPVATPKAVKDPKTRKDKQPATASGNASPPSGSDCLSNSEGGKATTKQRLQRWSYGAARVACKHLSLDGTDANGIASELRRLAKKHGDGLQPGMQSAAALLEELTVNAETTFADGAAIVGALRNRWGEWTQPGGTVPTWTPPEPLVDPDEPTAADLRLKAIVERAVSEDKAPTIEDIMAMGEPPTPEQRSQGPSVRGSAEAPGVLAELREHAIANICESPDDTESPTAYGREVGRQVIVLWRHPDGRESLQLIGRGAKAPQMKTQEVWAGAAWPDVAFDALERDEAAPAVTLTTREAVG